MGRHSLFISSNAWFQAGYFTVCDLPIQNGKINVKEVNSHLSTVGETRSTFLQYCAFQGRFSQFFTNPVPGTFIPSDLLLVHTKSLLNEEMSSLLSLDRWSHFFEKIPLDVVESERVFNQMLVFCKINKFKEVNYKILSRILLTPKILATIKDHENFNLYCMWCSGFS